MNKKQKVDNVDKGSKVFDLRKLPNVMPDTVALECHRDRKYTFACKFSHRLSVPQSLNVLDAIVLQNGICVLISKVPLTNVQQIEFGTKLNTDGISGRQKKGALKLRAGAVICTITYVDGSVVELLAPVGGKLLELNEIVCQRPELLSLKFDSEGYLAVVYPDTEIPSLDGYPDYKSLAGSFAHKNVEKGVCFDFQNGTCTRGDSCRFKHRLVESTTIDPVEVV